MKTNKFSFKGWEIKKFLQGRKKLLVAGIGALVGYIITQDPAFSGLAGAGAELLYAALDFYLKE